MHQRSIAGVTYSFGRAAQRKGDSLSGPAAFRMRRSPQRSIVNAGGSALDGWKGSLKSVLVGALTGTAIGLLGFLLSQNHRPDTMGPVLFMLVPFATGFAIGILSQDTRSLIAASILAAMFALVMLIAWGWEGTLCVLMAIPLLFIGLGVGAALGLLFNKLITKFRGGNNNLTLTSVVLLSMPLLILAGHRVEKSTLIHPRR
jgi:hypothetical protein